MMRRIQEPIKQAKTVGIYFAKMRMFHFLIHTEVLSFLFDNSHFIGLTSSIDGFVAEKERMNRLAPRANIRFARVEGFAYVSLIVIIA